MARHYTRKPKARARYDAAAEKARERRKRRELRYRGVQTKVDETPAWERRRMKA